jgi:response regulator RpfG family c-di-GMP phosphodiesterase
VQTTLEDRHALALTTVLAVDDEPAVLSALSRLLRPDGTRVLTASGGAEALALLEEHGPAIGAIISDYSMPEMNGAELLGAVRLRWPDITRVMLTGNADLPAAARAVNEGQLSRLYTKPWQPDLLRQAVAQALEQFRMLQDNRRVRILADEQAAHLKEQAARLEEQAARLEQWNLSLEQIVAERTAQLQQANTTLHRGLLDAVKLLLTLLERRLPQRAASCREAARLAGRLAERAGLTDEEARRVQVAALVHDIGLVGLPDPLLRRSPSLLPPPARAEYERHPIIGQNMLGTVEQLADFATWIRHHHERWDGNGYPDGLAGAAIPLPARLIALADGYVEAVRREGSTATRWRLEQRFSGTYDPDLLNRLDDEIRGAPITVGETRRVEPELFEPEGVVIQIGELYAGMVLAEPLQTAAGAPLLAAREPLTLEQVERIQKLFAAGALVGNTVAIYRAGSAESKTQKPDE